MSKYLIYALVDPRTDAVRYVGRSSSGLKRPAHHGRAWNLARDKTRKGHWIRSLIKAGVTYTIRTLEKVADPSLLNAAEMRWIAHGREVGWRLVNLTDGGGGITGFRHRDESLKAMADKTRAMFENPVYRAAHAGRLKAFFADPAERAAVSVRSTAQFASPAARKKATDAANKRWARKGEREHIAAAGRQRFSTVEGRTAHSRARGGSAIVDQNGVVYPSAAEAARILDLCTSNVNGVLHGQRRQTGGYVFTRVTDA